MKSKSKVENEFMLLGLDMGSGSVKFALRDRDGTILREGIVPNAGKPRKAALKVLKMVQRLYPNAKFKLGVTGASAGAVKLTIGIEAFLEAQVLQAAVAELNPDTRYIVQIGEQFQSCFSFIEEPDGGGLLLEQVLYNENCAAGSGAFLDGMVPRLKFFDTEGFADIEEFKKAALSALKNAANVAGRCGVFTESDIVHLFQKGTPRERLAAGICLAVVRSYMSTVAQPVDFTEGTTIFIGGVSENEAVIEYLRLALEARSEGKAKLVVPEHNTTYNAIGAAILAATEVDLTDAIGKLEKAESVLVKYDSLPPLRLVRSTIMKTVAELPEGFVPKEIGLGVDIGSWSTKAAAVAEDEDGNIHVLAVYYNRTQGDPIEATRFTMDRVHEELVKKGIDPDSVEIFVGTTGSGRYLTGDLLGADVIRNEITAQKEGTVALLGRDKNIGVIEQGGQDGKWMVIKGGVLVRYGMNKNCAAGTGAFLERQAGVLGLKLEEFGPVGLTNQAPAVLSDVCSLFCASGVKDMLANNVPVEELAAGIGIASAGNFLTKTIGTETFEDVDMIVFQGAVAFNQVMVAAFEAKLGRPIVVPPYPHLTGAIGVATLALRSKAAKSRFRGFKAVKDLTYTVSSFECRHCPNRCDVNIFTINDPTSGKSNKYFYNDRCEKYSGAQRKGLGDGLPNLFQEHKEKLGAEDYYVDRFTGPKSTKKLSPNARVVIMRQTDLFATNFVFWREYFAELGFEIVVTEETNKDIIEQGVRHTPGKPCIPMKTQIGHFHRARAIATLLKETYPDAEIVHFAPRYISLKPVGGHKHSATCPYIIAGADLGKTLMDLAEFDQPVLDPTIHERLNQKQLRHVCIEMARGLGKTARTGIQAFDKARQAHEEFTEWKYRRGDEVLALLERKNLQAFVVVARPYVAYDGRLSMDIAKKILDLGIVPIPQDFLRLYKANVVRNWPGIYPAQGQRKAAAAQLIRQNPRLRAVVVTYYACGPDSFLNPFFKEELGELCFVMQIDEHTADAGVITRMEAYADTVANVVKRPVSPIILDTSDTPIGQVKGRTILIPYAYDAAKALSAVLGAYDYDARPLPRSGQAGLREARAVIDEDVCHPMLVTTGDGVHALKYGGFDPDKTAIFQGKSDAGPCRFGMYYMLQRRIFEKLGYHNTPFVTFSNREENGGLGMFFTFLSWSVIASIDLLQRMLLYSRPRERRQGDCDRIYDRYLEEITNAVPDLKRTIERHSIFEFVAPTHLEQLEWILDRACDDFLAAIDTELDLPRIGILGEWFVRAHSDSNQDIVRTIEQQGAEAWLAPGGEFFLYSNYITGELDARRLNDSHLAPLDRLKLRFDVAKRRLYNKLALRTEHRLFGSTREMLRGLEDAGPEEIVLNATRYLSFEFGGEAHCTLGKAIDMWLRGISGLISIGPFNCLPSEVVAMLIPHFRRDHDHVPFIALDFDGFESASRTIRLINLIHQAKQYHASRRGKSRIIKVSR